MRCERARGRKRSVSGARPRGREEARRGGDTAAREAQARGLPFEEELLRYVVHGTLHLLGYDDHDDADRERMHARQEELLAEYLGAP